MSQRCWLDAAICLQNFLLQNGTFRVLVYERSGEPNMSKKKEKHRCTRGTNEIK